MVQNINKPLVSVAIITYNQIDFLREAIESVLLQNYSPIEIVVGDDCSTDGTQEMLQDMSQQHPGKFVLSLSKVNQGITHNSNAVHFACKGKYIAWLGGDDLMLPGKIRKQVEFMEAHPECNLVYHHLDVFESATGKHLHYYNTSKDTHTGGVKELIKHGTFNGACATMVRRSASPAYGFDERLIVASDWLYWIEHLINGGTIGFIDEVLGRYRRHSENVSSHNSAYAAQGYKDFLETCNIIMNRHPQYKRLVKHRLSVFHRGMRKHDYSGNLIKSLQYDSSNIISLVMLFVYKASFKKIKL